MLYKAPPRIRWLARRLDLWPQAPSRDRRSMSRYRRNRSLNRYSKTFTVAQKAIFVGNLERWNSCPSAHQEICYYNHISRSLSTVIAPFLLMHPSSFDRNFPTVVFHISIIKCIVFYASLIFRIVRFQRMEKRWKIEVFNTAWLRESYLIDSPFRPLARRQHSRWTL